MHAAGADNVEECFIIALRPGHDLLKERCLEFVRENFAAVLDASNGFERTAREEPASALRELLVFKHPVRARGKWRKPAGWLVSDAAESLSPCSLNRSCSCRPRLLLVEPVPPRAGSEQRRPCGHRDDQRAVEVGAHAG